MHVTMLHICVLVLFLVHHAQAAAGVLPLTLADTIEIAHSVEIKKSNMRVSMFSEETVKMINSFGSIAAIRYQGHSNGWRNDESCRDIRRKLLLMLVRSHDYATSQQAMLVLVRIDALLDKTAKTRVDVRCPNEHNWVNSIGWPKKLTLHVDTLGSGIAMVTLPAFENGDCASSVITLPGLRAPVYDSEVPRNIICSGRDTPGQALPIVDKIQGLMRAQHPEWTLYDMPLSRFGDDILEWEGPRVLAALNGIQPNAYKADLYRAAALYHMGGVWLDAKIVSVGPMDEWLPRHGAILPIDCRDNSLFNGAMALPPRDPIARKIVDGIVHRVETKDYGTTPLDVAGPRLLYSVLASHLSANPENERYHLGWQVSKNGVLIHGTEDGYPALILHNVEYRRTAHGFDHYCHYSNQWTRRTVYYEEVCEEPLAHVGDASTA